MDDETLKIVIPAIIGAAGAIAAFLIKDLLLYEFREYRNRKLQMLDRRLAQLYGPVVVAMKGGEGMLSNIFQEDSIFEKFMSNMHLFSPELQSIARDYMKLGSDVRVNEMPPNDKQQAIELSRKFNEVLIMEYQVLLEQFNGGFWRTRLLMQSLTKRFKRSNA